MRSKNRFRPILEPVDRRVLLSTLTPTQPAPDLPRPNQQTLRFSTDRYEANPVVPEASILIFRGGAWKDRRKGGPQGLPGKVQAEFWTETTDSAGHPHESARQPVTFRPGQSTATLRVPTHPEGVGDPAGSTTVLHLKPLSPGVVAVDPGSFQVDPVDSRATLTVDARARAAPPRVVSTQATSQGVVIEFDRPMNRDSLSDPRHYRVEWSPPYQSRNPGLFDTLGFILTGKLSGKGPPPPVRIRIAQVEASPDDRSVTLVAARKLDLSRTYTVSIDGPGQRSDSLRDNVGIPMPLATWLDATRRKRSLTDTGPDPMLGTIFRA